MKLFNLLFLALTLEAVNAAPSDWQLGKSKRSEGRLIFDVESIDKEFDKVLVGVQLQLAPGWYTYWKNAGDFGYSPKVTWTLPSTWAASEVRFAPPQRHRAPGKKELTSFGYKKDALYLMELKGKGPVSGKLSWEFLVCEKACVPEKLEFEFSLDASGRKSSTFAGLLNAAKSKLPSPMGSLEVQRLSDSEFIIPYSGEPITDLFLYSPVKQKNFWSWRQEENGIFVKLEPSLEVSEALIVTPNHSFEFDFTLPIATQASTDPLWLIIIFAFIGGLILNFMPCVLPVVILKTHSLLVAGREAKKNLLATSLGIITSFISLGLLTAALREAGMQVGWGFQFQIPAFLVFIIFVLLLFAFNLFGLFEIELSHKMNQRMGGGGPFFEGVFATILATPCSAPFLGSALTYGLTRGIPELILMFFVMGLGLSTPYLIFLIRPDWIKKIPKPGKWMETLKRVLAYFLIGTGLWLLYVLQQQVASYFLVLMLIGFVFLFIIIREIKHPLRWLLMAGLCFGLIESARAPELLSSQASENFSFSEEAVQTKLEDGKTLFLYITADWCITCKFNEANVIETKEFKELLKAKNIELVRVDWTKRDPKVAAYLEKYGRIGIPFATLLRGQEHQLFPELMTLDETKKIIEKWTTSLE